MKPEVMKRIGKIFLWIALFAGATPYARALPDMSTSSKAGSLTVYRDAERSNLFYYLPGDLVVATGSDGRPEVHMLLMRYTGTAARGDQKVVVYRSLFTFRIIMYGPVPEQIAEAERALTKNQLRPELRPLPVRRLESALVYTPVTGGSEAVRTSTLDGKQLSTLESEKEKSNVYWSERDYTLSLDQQTAQVFWEALQKGSVVLSIGYAFIADAAGAGEQAADLSGSPELVRALRRRLQGEGKEENVKSKPVTGLLVKAGAASVTLDANRWPELLRRIDLNESVPPGYGVLDIYCYDFNNNLRKDLHQKEIELEAEGIGGDPVRLRTAFRGKQPDIYARNIRFPFAVRLDRPYRYRVIEIKKDGSVYEGPWINRETWNEILDVTSPPRQEDGENEGES